MTPCGFDVRPWAGREGQLQVVDQESGGWGNIGLDEIVFSDTPVEPEIPFAERSDFGTLGLALWGDEVTAVEAVGAGNFPEASSLPPRTMSGPSRVVRAPGVLCWNRARSIR